MELKELQELWEKKSVLFCDREEVEITNDVFSKCCKKTQELILGSILISNDCYALKTMCQRLDFVNMTPIEQIYLTAFIIYTHFSNRNLQNKIGFEIFSQQPIMCGNKEYVVDFLINKATYNGQEFELNNKVVIECDGYDYHSSKQQRNNDTERENNLKLIGYSVIRFTGSQIYKDPYLCVIQTIKFLFDRNKELNFNIGETNGNI